MTDGVFSGTRATGARADRRPGSAAAPGHPLLAQPPRLQARADAPPRRRRARGRHIGRQRSARAGHPHRHPHRCARAHQPRWAAARRRRAPRSSAHRAVHDAWRGADRTRCRSRRAARRAARARRRAARARAACDRRRPHRRRRARSGGRRRDPRRCRPAGAHRLGAAVGAGLTFVGHDSGVPGPDADGGAWLAARNPRFVGSDTTAFEHIPAGEGHARLPVHRIMLVERGVPIIEMLNLEMLAARGGLVFDFVISPLPLLGCHRLAGAPARHLRGDRSDRTCPPSSARLAEFAAADRRGPAGAHRRRLARPHHRHDRHLDRGARHRARTGRPRPRPGVGRQAAVLAVRLRRPGSGPDRRARQRHGRARAGLRRHPRSLDPAPERIRGPGRARCGRGRRGLRRHGASPPSPPATRSRSGSATAAHDDELEQQRLLRARLARHLDLRCDRLRGRGRRRAAGWMPRRHRATPWASPRAWAPDSSRPTAVADRSSGCTAAGPLTPASSPRRSPGGGSPRPTRCWRAASASSTPTRDASDRRRVPRRPRRGLGARPLLRQAVPHERLHPHRHRRRHAARAAAASRRRHRAHRAVGADGRHAHDRRAARGEDPPAESRTTRSSAGRSRSRSPGAAAAVSASTSTTSPRTPSTTHSSAASPSGCWYVPDPEVRSALSRAASDDRPSASHGRRCRRGEGARQPRHRAPPDPAGADPAQVRSERPWPRSRTRSRAECGTSRAARIRRRAGASRGPGLEQLNSAR